MTYFSINPYRKMLNCAIAEGMSPDDFMALSTPINMIDDLQVVPAEEFLSMHEILADKLGSEFGIMKSFKDYNYNENLTDKG